MRQPDPRVPRRSLNDRSSRLQHALGLCIFYQEQGGTILDTSTGGHEFRFCEDVASCFFGKLGKADEGCVPNGTDEAVDFTSADGEARDGMGGRCHGADGDPGGEAMGDGSERGLEHRGGDEGMKRSTLSRHAEMINTGTLQPEIQPPTATQ